MIAVYALSAMWAVGCFVLPLWGAWVFFREGDTAPALGVLFIVFPLCVLMGAAPWAFIKQGASPDLATLKKNEWVCTEAHYVTTTTYVKSGSVLVPVTSRSEVCDQYNRTGGSA